MTGKDAMQRHATANVIAYKQQAVRKWCLDCSIHDGWMWLMPWTYSLYLLCPYRAIDAVC